MEILVKTFIIFNKQNQLSRLHIYELPVAQVAYTRFVVHVQCAYTNYYPFGVIEEKQAVKSILRVRIAHIKFHHVKSSTMAFHAAALLPMCHTTAYEWKKKNRQPTYSTL